MIPGSFDYHSPTTLDEAVALLGEHGANAKILAGGQSLIPAMRFRLAMPEILIDINRLPDLDAIRQQNGSLVIGGLTRESALEEAALIQESYPLLADTARVIADPLVRN
ncbi:MAG: FAD binding domain-containing protein, partial [Thermoanaerobaculia bacterium]